MKLQSVSVVSLSLLGEDHTDSSGEEGEKSVVRERERRSSTLHGKCFKIIAARLSGTQKDERSLRARARPNLTIIITRLIDETRCARIKIEIYHAFLLDFGILSQL